MMRWMQLSMPSTVVLIDNADKTSKLIVIIVITSCMSADNITPAHRPPNDGHHDRVGSGSFGSETPCSVAGSRANGATTTSLWLNRLSSQAKKTYEEINLQRSLRTTWLIIVYHSEPMHTVSFLLVLEEVGDTAVRIELINHTRSALNKLSMLEI